MTDLEYQEMCEEIVRELAKRLEWDFEQLYPLIEALTYQHGEKLIGLLNICLLRLDEEFWRESPYRAQGRIEKIYFEKRRILQDYYRAAGTAPIDNIIFNLHMKSYSWLEQRGLEKHAKAMIINYENRWIPWRRPTYPLGQK